MQTDISIEGIYPLLAAQRGLLVDSAAGEGDQYRQQICVQLNKRIAPYILEERIEQLVAHHRLLRTIFDWSDDEPVQIVVSGLRPSITIQGINNQDELNTILEEERKMLQSVSDAPPIRFIIIEKQSQLFLGITYHHVLLDGPSVNLLLDQIITGPPFLPEIPTSAYSEWHKRSIGENEHDVWRELLRDLKSHDGYLGDSMTEEVRRFQGELDRGFVNTLFEKAKRLQVTPATLMQALWSEWAISYFDKSALLFGLVTGTRLPELSEALGPYISTLPWHHQKSNTDFAGSVSETHEKLLLTSKARHVPLGRIVQNASSLAMSFDALLTIATRPVRSTGSFEILQTYENTGYKLSVDIEIKDTVSVTFATLLGGMEEALDSFLSYARQQIDSHDILPVETCYQMASSQDSHVKTEIRDPEKERKLISYLARILDMTIEEIDGSESFLALGGDSIIALRLKSLLKSEGLEVSVGDILQSNTVRDLASKLKEAVVLPDIEAILHNTEQEQQVPSGAAYIIKAYQNGFGQDYHEQTAFCLKGTCDSSVFAQALNHLAAELPTLRLIYTKDLKQKLSQRPRISFEETSEGSFESFVNRISKDHLRKPFDISKGPLLRLAIGKNKNREWYLFMSFSALVTDGWSFATMLERLLSIYNELLNGAYTSRTDNSYIEYSSKPQVPQVSPALFDAVGDDYVSDISGVDFVIPPGLAKKIFKRSKENHRTVSKTLLQYLRKTLISLDFSSIKIYENGRDEPEYFSSVGPYSFLTNRTMGKNGEKHAYYVFENYPRDSENHLKEGKVQNFDEYGNWRRDLLPPLTSVGFLFDVVGEQINVRVLVRKKEGEKPSAYWKSFIEILGEE